MNMEGAVGRCECGVEGMNKCGGYGGNEEEDELMEGEVWMLYGGIDMEESSQSRDVDIVDGWR